MEFSLSLKGLTFCLRGNTSGSACTSGVTVAGAQPLHVVTELQGISFRLTLDAMTTRVALPTLCPCFKCSTALAHLPIITFNSMVGPTVFTSSNHMLSAASAGFIGA